MNTRDESENKARDDFRDTALSALDAAFGKKPDKRPDATPAGAVVANASGVTAGETASLPEDIVGAFRDVVAMLQSAWGDHGGKVPVGDRHLVAEVQIGHQDLVVLETVLDHISSPSSPSGGRSAINGAYRVIESFPTEGFECYWIVDADGNQVGHINGPQSGRQKQIAAEIAAAITSPAPGVDVLREALEAALSEREWLLGLVETQTCGDLCDKTHEFRGCHGECARDVGIRKFRETTDMITAALHLASDGAGVWRCYTCTHLPVVHTNNPFAKCHRCGQPLERALPPKPAPEPFNPATSPGMTDMMVAPETLDKFMEENPLPAEPQGAGDSIKAVVGAAFNLSPADQFSAAFQIAENVGYVLTKLCDEPANEPQGDAVRSKQIAFLNEMASYFDRRDTGGEDSVHWANVYNAENCRKIAAALAAPAGKVGEPVAWQWRKAGSTDEWVISSGKFDAEHLKAYKIEQRPLYAAPSTALDREAVVEALTECADKARQFARHYDEGSDARNTFILLAEWIEGKAALSTASAAVTSIHERASGIVRSTDGRAVEGE